MNGLKKSTINRLSRRCAQSAHCAHTGHVKGKKGSLDSPKASQLFTFGPKVQGTALRGS